ncbi:unnamed protein product, partial [Laminaria digitata]
MMAHEQLLVGGEYFRWKWLRLLRSLGNKGAAEAIDGELDAMDEISLGQGMTAAQVLPSPVTPVAGQSEGEMGTEAVVGAGTGTREGGALCLSRKVAEAFDIKSLLAMNTDEVDNLVRALEGSYVKPGVGGDLLRDGAGVLPTGRNMHALDPYRMPSPAAWSRGQEAARKILDAHVADTGEFPETIAAMKFIYSQSKTPFCAYFRLTLYLVSIGIVMMWGLDAIKTRGESVAIALSLIGARPVKEGTGRVVKYELVPLEELNRPRVDVLASLSGIFRDSFANVVDLLDDLFEVAAAAE